MLTEKRKSKSNISTKNAHSILSFAIHNERDARTAFASFLPDEQAAKTAATFIKLGKELAGNTANRETGESIYQRFYEQIVRDSQTNKERTQEEKTLRLSETLTAMREENLAARSSPEARRAHLEIASYNEERDNLRALFEVPEGRTRQEHATHLNKINQELRDLYERGATFYGNTLIIPSDANNSIDKVDQVRIGSLSHAVREFAPIVGEEKAKEKAIEFVELGRNIAGRTTDGDTTLVVFREFYNQIKKDERGRILSHSEQAERLNVVIERMRELSDSMLKEEWQREPVEILSLNDWERRVESRQRDAEIETSERVSYRLEETLEHEFDDEREEIEHERTNERTEDILTRTNSNLNNISYERISLDDTSPRLPQSLSQEDETRLRYEIIPLMDRSIESGARPQEIIKALSIKANNEARKMRDAEISNVLFERAPMANREHKLTREEEARALYTLQALGVISNEVIREKGFTMRERADAIDVVGTRLAQDYRKLSAKLKSFTELETEREQLALAAKEYSDAQRKSPEFQTLFTSLREQERTASVSEHDALIKSNNASIKQPSSLSYTDLADKARPLSLFSKQQQENKLTQSNLREQLQSLLINPEIERARNSNAGRLTEMTIYFSRITNQGITNSDEARTALQPELGQMRGVLNRLAEERATIKVERTIGNENLLKPIYVGLPSKQGLRLAVENFNEYKSLERAASNLSINVETYKGRYGQAINSYSISREEELEFARDYVNYRLLDETTRLKNGNRLFREFGTRLNNAGSQENLRETINSIRRENYAREKFPERFASETEARKRSGEQPRRPLNEIELKKLFLAQSPSHYTTEMRELRLNYSLTKGEKTERIKGLESGVVEPSSALKTLLTEFERTRSNNQAQTARNIKAFLADYLNPPSYERNRFSPHNLFEIRQNLTTAERDYFFKVIDSTRQAAISGSQSIQLDQQGKERIHGNSIGPVQQLKNLRDEIKEHVSNYLFGVAQTRGVQAFESNREGLYHAIAVSNIVKETFKQNGLEFEAYNLTDERINTVAGKLVGELPQALRERGRQIGSIEILERLPSLAKEGRDINKSREITDKREMVVGVSLNAQTSLEPVVDQNPSKHNKELAADRNSLVISQGRELSNAANERTSNTQQRAQDVVAKNQHGQRDSFILSR